MITERTFQKFNGCPRQAKILLNSAQNSGGREMGSLSRRLREIQAEMLKSFPPGRRVYGGAYASARQTRELMDKGVDVIYDACFIAGMLFCRCDVIIRKGDGYNIYAVRPTTHFNGLLEELRYCSIVMERAGIEVCGMYSCSIDKSAENTNILKMVDAKNEARRKNIENKMDLILSFSKADVVPDAVLEKRCGSCVYRESCFDCSPESILALKSLPFASKVSLWRSGVKKISDYVSLGLQDEKVLREIKVIESDEDVYDAKAIRDFLKDLQYPLGFLDFETMEVFVPNDAILSPMDTVITQFSYHLLDEEGGELKHFDFIGDGESYPERDAAKRLLEVIKPNHTVLMYSPYEKICIERLMKRLPEYREKLGFIVKNLVDLEKPFEKKYIINRRMKGKFGLKSVLPALYPNDKALDYKYMKIQNGRQAESIYSRLPKMKDDERESAREDLRDYCAMDTYAMVMLLDKLKYYAKK